eukprot:TRINITY_DN758_c0_g1_i2.p1 TRINITY_DN758_c0_g1~~TRINITY_DN758_c0_g1_i2.p1  ORF type:complete len:290 (-),score=11.81 TRINITY_DN758_c0_g1_i2:272-1141(-)
MSSSSKWTQEFICPQFKECGTYDVKKNEVEDYRNEERNNFLDALCSTIVDVAYLLGKNFTRQQFRPRGYPCLLTQFQLKQHSTDIASKIYTGALEVMMTPCEQFAIVVRGFGDGPWQIGFAKLNDRYSPKNSTDITNLASTLVHHNPIFLKNGTWPLFYSGSTFREACLLCSWSLASKLTKSIVQYQYQWIDIYDLKTVNITGYFRIVTFGQYYIVVRGYDGQFREGTSRHENKLQIGYYNKGNGTYNYSVLQQVGEGERRAIELETMECVLDPTKGDKVLCAVVCEQS